jgi:Lon protease-like protein
MFETYDLGTLAKIIDWNQGDDGLLGVTTMGTQKFKLKSMHKQERAKIPKCLKPMI